jgi:oligopeptide transport system substrate-binding protein
MTAGWLRACLAAAAAVLLATAAHAQGTPQKVLTVPRSSPFETLDPPRQFSLQTNDIVVMVYNTLLRFSYLQRPYQLEPDLLERMPELSADRLSYTFTLKKGLRFHDSPAFPGGKGREVTADDVLYSLRRYADARINTKSWFAMEGTVAGLDAWRAATAKAPASDDLMAVPVEGLQKLDKLRLRIKLTKPNPLFLYTLAMSPTAVVPLEAVRHFGDKFALNPVGTGPFTLSNADRKGVLHLVKNPNYHGVYPSSGAPGDAEKGLLKDAGRQLPFLDAVDMPLIEEAQPTMLRFLNGELDRVAVDRANFIKMARLEASGELRLNDEYSKRFDLHATPSLSVFYFTLNMKDPVLGAHKKLRQALAHLVDTGSEINVLLNGRGRPISSIVPLDLPGSERDTGAVRRGYDLAAAKRLLAEAGFPGGQGLPAFTVTFQNTDSNTRNRFDLHRARFAAAGVQLKAQFLDYPSFVKVTEASNFQIADFAWNADYPDAENFYQLLYSKNVAPGPNLGSWVNADFDRGYEATRHMPDGPQRLAHFREMNARVLDEAPVLFNYSPVRVSITQKWLRNFKRNLLQPEFEFLDIDLARKTAKP